jgi:L-ribulose-5-phosphate 3-epimerase
MPAIKVGITTALEDGPRAAIMKVGELGLSACQVTCVHEEPLTEENAAELRFVAADQGIEIATMSVHIPVRQVWSFDEGPSTIGLAPLQNRAAGMRMFKKTSDFARWAGVPSIKIHLGFTPIDPRDALYIGMIDELKTLAAYCAANGNDLWLECGQEPPVVLLRTIQDVGASNVFINHDANLQIYGMGNVVDSLKVYGQYVRGVHIKDGEYPTDGHKLGAAKPIGQGSVDFKGFIGGLAARGFAGVLCIEMGIKPENVAEIQRAAAYLQGIVDECGGVME